MSAGLRAALVATGLVALTAWAPSGNAVVRTSYPRDPSHGWNEKSGQWERCFGAVGSGCDGVNIAGLGAPVTRNRDGSFTAHVSVGSIMHDNCCYANGPSARWCKPNETADPGRVAYDESPAGHAGHCSAEWDKAVYNMRDGRQWTHTFGPYGPEGGDDITPVKSRGGQLVLNGRWITYGGSESPATRRLAAPSGTSLDVQDEAFCASGHFKSKPWAPPGIGAWGVCS